MVVQTPAERREKWHQFFRDVRDPRTPNMVFDFKNGTMPGEPNCRVRMDSLGNEFAADAPYIPNFPRPDALGVCWPGAGSWQDHNPQ